MNETTLELLKPIMIDFDKLKVGMTVFDIGLGEAIIENIDFTGFETEYRIYNKLGKEFGEEYKHPLCYLQDPFDYLAGMVGEKSEKEESIYPIPNLAYYKKIAGELDQLFNRMGCKTNENSKLEKKRNYEMESYKKG